MIYYYNHKTMDMYPQKEIELFGYDGIVEFSALHGMDPAKVFAEIKQLEENIKNLNREPYDVSSGKYKQMMDYWLNRYVEFFNNGAKHGKQAYVVIGNIASGKSHTCDLIEKETGSIIVDADRMKMGEMTDRGFYEGLSSLYTPLERDLVQEPCSVAGKQLLDMVSSEGMDLILPKAPANYEKLERQLQMLENRGYDIHLILVEAPIDICASRSYVRYLKKETAGNVYPNGIVEHGRFVPVSVVTYYGDRVYSTFAKAKGIGRYKSYTALYNDNSKSDRIDIKTMAE